MYKFVTPVTDCASLQLSGFWFQRDAAGKWVMLTDFFPLASNSSGSPATMLCCHQEVGWTHRGAGDGVQLLFCIVLANRNRSIPSEHMPKASRAPDPITPQVPAHKPVRGQTTWDARETFRYPSHGSHMQPIKAGMSHLFLNAHLQLKQPSGPSFWAGFSPWVAVTTASAFPSSGREGGHVLRANMRRYCVQQSVRSSLVACWSAQQSACPRCPTACMV